MPSEHSSDVRFEIGHVLFIDIVGYSKLLINEQAAQLKMLRDIVCATEQFRAAQAEGKLLRLPTGDGGALVFRTTPEAPVVCAIEVAKALKTHPQLRVRMGIHSGPVQDVLDLNEQANIAGAGINFAQRVMDCGDAGHLLLSKRVADDLEQYGRWRPLLHELGTCEIKHGSSLSVVNLYSDEIGNPEPPNKFRREQLRDTKFEPSTRVHRKSIAILPFENLSEDKANAYFADGVQEELLTKLSRIGDLKVISRTSVQRFRNSSESIPQIAVQLGVAHILEGTVQKAADQVRVNVQLIDAQNDAHLWAERYDRKLTDIFAVETEIAKAIADQLQARITGAEQHAIALRPTKSIEAHEAYLRGLHYWYKYPAPGFEKCRDYFQQAVALDPNYALSYIGLSSYHGFAAANGLLPPNENWQKFEAALNKARALDDTLAELYNGLAALKLYYYRDWPAAERFFRHGIELNPNYAEIRHHLAINLVIFGRNEEALTEMGRAAELDPIALRNNFDRAKIFFFIRNYDRAIYQFHKTLELEQNFPTAHEWLGYAYEQNEMRKEAIAEWSKALALSGEGEQASMVERISTASGFDAAVFYIAEQRLEKLNQRIKRGEYVAAMEYVISSMRLGNKEQAFSWLAKAVCERNRAALEFKVDPRFDSLRGDPRFEKIAADLTLKE